MTLDTIVEEEVIQWGISSWNSLQENEDNQSSGIRC